VTTNKNRLPNAEMKLPKTNGRAYSTTKEKEKLKIESLEEKSLGYHIIGFNISVDLKILKHDNQVNMNIFQNTKKQRRLEAGTCRP
jgi:hypothetical protein